MKKAPSPAKVSLTPATVAALGASIAGCGHDTPATPPLNRPPVAVGSIPPLTIAVDSAAAVDVANYFSDLDSDPLAYAAASSDTSRAVASVEGSVVTIAGMARGEATVTVTASDGAGAAAQQPVAVTVVPGRPVPLSHHWLSSQDTVGIIGSSWVAGRWLMQRYRGDNALSEKAARYEFVVCLGDDNPSEDECLKRWSTQSKDRTMVKGLPTDALKLWHRATSEYHPASQWVKVFPNDGGDWHNVPDPPVSALVFGGNEWSDNTSRRWAAAINSHRRSETYIDENGNSTFDFILNPTRLDSIGAFTPTSERGDTAGHAVAHYGRHRVLFRDFNAQPGDTATAILHTHAEVFGRLPWPFIEAVDDYTIGTGAGSICGGAGLRSIWMAHGCFPADAFGLFGWMEEVILHEIGHVTDHMPPFEAAYRADAAQNGIEWVASVYAQPNQGDGTFDLTETYAEHFAMWWVLRCTDLWVWQMREAVEHQFPNQLAFFDDHASRRGWDAPGERHYCSHTGPRRQSRPA